MFPSLDINTISSIAMIIATNTAVIFAIIFLTHNLLGIIFQIYPGSRLLIETILIKIGGSLYGPTIGMLIGLLTDLLTVILTSSVFNYGYLFAAVFNGFLGGFIFIVLRDKKTQEWFSRMLNNISVVGLMSIAATAFYFFHQATFANGQHSNGISLNIFSQSISFPSWFFPAFLSTILALLLFSLISTNLVSLCSRTPKIVKTAQRFNSLTRLTAVNFIAYVLVDIITLPLFDIMISTLPYEQFFIMRNLFLIPSVAFSSLIIWKIFKLDRKLNFSATQQSRLSALPCLTKPAALIFSCNSHLNY
ncbi:glutamyl-tRNA amidotransferase [Candidatus Mycoplasma haematominutum]|nr:glutamyl-tRNA amidotransferase [Candidatus Mycoplasma haematominutum]